MGFEKSDRLEALPPYLFIEIDRKKREAIRAGKDVINLGVGDPDRPTPKFIVDRMAEAIRDPSTHRYPFDEGVPEFRQQAAFFMKRRFDVALDPGTEIITTIGSKDGIAHLPLAVVNPGEVVLVPQPGYPVYQAAAIFAGGQVRHVPLLERNGFLPDLGAIDSRMARRAKLMFVNYPNNPTGAVAPLSFYEELVAFAREHGVIIASDAAYCETYFEAPPVSIFKADGARELAIEFHSLSKTFNMTGWRIGFAAGRPDVVAALAQVKGNCDSGQFNAIQHAGVEALRNPDHIDVRAMLDVYRERRDVLCDGLASLGWRMRKPSATFYVWAPCPGGRGSMEVATRLLEEANVVAIPGVGFGEAGEGYIRFALTVEAARIREAVDRISKLSW